jgi:hypothetical protein
LKGVRGLVYLSSCSDFFSEHVFDSRSVMPLHESIVRLLESGPYIRSDPNGVDEAFRGLAVRPSPDVSEFYSRFEGPFTSPHSGFVLLDPCGAGVDDSLCVATHVCRDTFSLPRHFIVISAYVGNGALMLDTLTDKVFNVDFEGGIEELLQGALPSEGNFLEFLAGYFLGPNRSERSS